MAEDKLIVALTADIKDLSNKLKEAQNKLNEFAGGVNNAVNTITLDGLENQLQALNAELKNTAIGSVRFKELGEQIAATETKINNAFNSIGSGGVRNLNSLNNSINQITRELPAFGISANLGFLAVSNNIPILVDEINKLKLANQDLAAKGKPVQSIFGAITGALFSYQTAISVAITLSTLYGSKLIEMLSKANGAGGAIDTLEKKQEALNKAYESKSVIGAVKDLFLLTSAVKQAKNDKELAKQVIDQYNESVGKVRGAVTTLTEVEKGLINNTSSYVSALIARESASQVAEEAAKTYIELNKAQLKSEQEFVSGFQQFKDAVAIGQKKSDEELNKLAQDKAKRDEAAKKAEVDRLKNNLNNLKLLMNGFQKDAIGLFKDDVSPKVVFKKGTLGFLNKQLKDLEDKKLKLNVDSSQFRDVQKQIEILQIKINEINDISFLSTADTTPLKEIKVKTDEANLAINGLKTGFRNAASEGSATMIPLLEELSQSGLEFVDVFGQGISGAFESALNGTQSFGEAFGSMLKQLLARILATVAAAAALSALLNIASGGAGFAINGVKFGFKEILGRLSGGLLGVGGNSNRVVSPVGVGAMGQGSVEFNIMGDKLYGVLKNYTSRLDRLQ